MSQSIHQQLIHGIKGLSTGQAQRLQGLLARVKDELGEGFGEGFGPGSGEETASGDDARLGDAPGDRLGIELASPTDGGPAACEADGDLPQPVCAQEEQAMPPSRGWGPPPLSGINGEQMQLIACLIREANEARNARRQRFGL